MRGREAAPAFPFLPDIALKSSVLCATLALRPPWDTGAQEPTWLVHALHRYTQVPSPTLSTLREDQSTRLR